MITESQPAHLSVFRQVKNIDQANCGKLWEAIDVKPRHMKNRLTADSKLILLGSNELRKLSRLIERPFTSDTLDELVDEIEDALPPGIGHEATVPAQPFTEHATPGKSRDWSFYMGEYNPLVSFERELLIGIVNRYFQVPPHIHWTNKHYTVGLELLRVSKSRERNREHTQAALEEVGSLLLPEVIEFDAIEYDLATTS